MVVKPSSELPKVFSPVKMEHIKKYEGAKLPNFYRNLRSRSEEQHKSEPTDLDSGSEDGDDLDSSIVTMRLSMEMMIYLLIMLMWRMRE